MENQEETVGVRMEEMETGVSGLEEETEQRRVEEEEQVIQGDAKGKESEEEQEPEQEDGEVEEDPTAPEEEEPRVATLPPPPPPPPMQRAPPPPPAPRLPATPPPQRNEAEVAEGGGAGGPVGLAALLQQRNVLNHVPMISEQERMERAERASLTGELATVLRRKQKEKITSQRDAVQYLVENFENGFLSVKDAKEALAEAARLDSTNSLTVQSTIAHGIVELRRSVTLLEGLTNSCNNATRLLKLTASSTTAPPLSSTSRAQSMPSFSDRGKQDQDSIAQQMRSSFSVLIRAQEPLNEVRARQDVSKLDIDLEEWDVRAYELTQQLSERLFQIGLERAQSLETLGKTKFDVMWRMKSATSCLSMAIETARELAAFGRTERDDEEARERCRRASAVLLSLQQNQSKVQGYFQPDDQLASTVALHAPMAPAAPTGPRGWFSSCYHGNLQAVRDYLRPLLKDGDADYELSDDVSNTSKLVVENIDIEDHLGDTALHLAVRKRHPEVVRLLLSLGANPLHKNRRGDSSLHDAAMAGSLTCCGLLLEVASSPEFVNDYNAQKETPLYCACKSASTAEHLAVIKLLVRKGADFSLPSASNQTPFQILSVRTGPSASSKNKAPAGQSIDVASASSAVFLNFRSYCRSPVLSDVTFVVGDVEIPAHRIVLCVQSRTFKTLLEGNWRESNQNRIKIPEFSAAAFGLIMDFLYTGDVTIPVGDLDLAFDVIRGADMYLLEGLRDQVGRLLAKQLALDNAFAIYTQASSYGPPKWFLWRECVDFILNNYTEIEFADSDRQVIFRLLDELASSMPSPSPIPSTASPSCPPHSSSSASTSRQS